MDHKKFGALARFAKDIENLNALCQQFKDVVASGKSDFQPVGTVGVDNARIVVTALFFEFRSAERIVRSENGTTFMELSFVTGEGESEVALVSCYLSTGGTVFTEPSFDNKLCDFNNSYASQHVLMFVADALEESSLFKPRTNRE